VSVKRECNIKWECEPSVKRKHGVSVKPGTVPSYTNMSDSELTDRLPQEDNTDDNMPPLLYGIEGDEADIDVFMPVPAPILATVSTASSLSRDSSVEFGVSISAAHPVAPRMGATGPSRISAASTGIGSVRVL
jgi:hypothetical protein